MIDTLCENGINKEGWYLLTDMSFAGIQEITQINRNRFQIEKTFQDQKSSGFDMEKSKIELYTRFKKLVFYCCFHGLFSSLDFNSGALRFGISKKTASTARRTLPVTLLLIQSTLEKTKHHRSYSFKSFQERRRRLRR